MTEKAERHNAGKNRLALIPSGPLWELARVYTNGAKKYATHNWEKGLSYLECMDAVLRHIHKFLAGYTKDEEIDCHHLACAIWGLMTLLHQEQHPYMYHEFDDRRQWFAMSNDSNPKEAE